jgi:hypothetical protein
MDPLTHVLVTRIFVDHRPTTLLAGIAADAPFYLTYSWWLLARGELRRAFASNTWSPPPRWMLRAHHAAHSLPLLLGIAMCARLITACATDVTGPTGGTYENGWPNCSRWATSASGLRCFLP